MGVDNPVFGHLEGGATFSVDEPVWLASPDGTILRVLWPAGFELYFEPEATVYDETGALFASAGDAVMAQVSRASAAGSYEDPYYLEGILLAGSFTPDDLSTGIRVQGCYPRLPE